MAPELQDSNASHQKLFKNNDSGKRTIKKRSPNVYFSFLMGQPQPLFHLFSSFQANITIFTTTECGNCPFNNQWRDSNPHPLEHESPPITTRPGLLPNIYFFIDQPTLLKNNKTLSLLSLTGWRVSRYVHYKLYLGMYTSSCT